MKILNIRSWTILLVALFSLNAQSALVVDPAIDCTAGQINASCWTTDDNSNPKADTMSALIGTTVSAFLYKAEVGNSTFLGEFADSYSTSFSGGTDATPDPLNGLLIYLGGDAIDCSRENSCFLSVKDGNNSPALYVFDISGWDGMADIDMQNFWPEAGAISNIAIWGGVPCDQALEECGGPPQDIPEPDGLFLFASGLLGLVWNRRKMTR